MRLSWHRRAQYAVFFDYSAGRGRPLSRGASRGRRKASGGGRFGKRVKTRWIRCPGAPKRVKNAYDRGTPHGSVGKDFPLEGLLGAASGPPGRQSAGLGPVLAEPGRIRARERPVVRRGGILPHGLRGGPGARFARPGGEFGRNPRVFPSRPAGSGAPKSRIPGRRRGRRGRPGPKGRQVTNTELTCLRRG